MTNLPAVQRTITDIMDEYYEKADSADKAVIAFQEACNAISTASVVQGKYVEPVAPHWHGSALTIQKNLLKSAWRALYDRLQVDRLATAEDKRRFELFFTDPKPFTMENVRAVFAKYFIDPRFHILRGLAEVFVTLDQSYRSHSKVKIGVKGLPKRVILTYWGSYSSHGRDKLRDIVNALAAYRGQPLMMQEEWEVINDALRKGEDACLIRRAVVNYQKEEVTLPDRGMTLRTFQNGNAHLFFDKGACIDINGALAEFYGECLPDAEPEDVKPSASTAVSKDLQFYWTPQIVAAQACDYADIREGMRVLEPSCGDGRIMDELRRLKCRAVGIEYHPGRASEARAKGHNVMTANFLQTAPTGDFDRVVMNPPFAGRHYAKHVRHAMNFLKPGGVLVSILPATAWYDHGELTGELAGNWRDLPVASFSEAGTNVPTGIFRVVKK